MIENINHMDFSGGTSGLPRQETEMWVWSLSQEYPLEEGMAPHFGILVWRISWTEQPGGLQSMGSQRVRHDWSDLVCMNIHTHTHTHTHTNNMPQMLWRKWALKRKWIHCNCCEGGLASCPVQLSPAFGETSVERSVLSHLGSPSWKPWFHCGGVGATDSLADVPTFQDKILYFPWKHCTRKSSDFWIRL